MYNIYELKEKELEELRSIAADLQVKGFKKMEKSDLVYAILDADAIKSAQNAPQRPAKKRGRPKKNEAGQEQGVNEAAPVEEPKKVRKPKKTEAPAAETKTYTFEEVRGILAGKSRSGHREADKALITKYGGTQLSDYKDDPEKLAALVAEAEVIGNG
jgi:hypothetical protein